MLAQGRGRWAVSQKPQKRIMICSNISVQYSQTSCATGLRKQPTFGQQWPALKRHLRNDYKNSIVMTCDYSDLGSASDWMKQILNQSEALPRSEQWPVISMEFLQSFLRHHFKETSVGVAKYQLFPPSNAKIWHLFMGGGCRQQVPTKSEITGKRIFVFWMGGHRWRFYSIYYTFHFQKWQSQNATYFPNFTCKILKTDSTS